MASRIAIHNSSEPHQANLVRVPAEILHNIFSQLSKLDHKALRETCHSLKNIATGYVFFRAHVSLLKADRDAFFSVCERPHLRAVVEQIVWYDIPSLPETDEILRIYAAHSCIARRRRLPMTSFDPAAIEDSNKGLMEMLRSLAITYGDAQWLDTSDGEAVTASEQYHSEQFETLKEFFTRFVKALEQLPKLKTAISRPVASDRVLCASSGYELIAGTFQDFPTQDSDAGVLMLLAAMQTSEDLDIKSFYFADHPNNSLISGFESSHANAFRKLELIDLCIGHTENEQSYAGLAACLRAATELRELKLCFENMGSSPESKSRLFKRGMFAAIFLDNKWEHLRSIDFVDLFFSPESLLEFISNHQSTLRHLKLQECDSTSRSWAPFFCGLLKQPELNLDTCLVSRGADMANRFDVRWIKEFLKNKEASGYSTVRILPSDEFFWDEDLWPEVVAYDIRRRPEAYGHRKSPLDDDDEDSDSDNLILPTPKTYWVTDRMDEDIVFWSTSDPNVGEYETEIWKFVYRDGRYAHSREGEKRPEPLEFFEDWDPEQGDKLEPTPYGDQFDMFVAQRQKLFFDPTDIEYPEHARIWLLDYDDKPLTQERIDYFKRTWKDKFEDSAEDSE